jgi:hypothetical protein
MPIPETLEFADWNKGKSFFEQYELLGPNGLGVHICIDIRDEIAARELARRVVACWNACAGISTEQLEAGRRPGDGDIEALADVMELLAGEGYHPIEEIESAVRGLEKLVEGQF